MQPQWSRYSDIFHPLCGNTHAQAELCQLLAISKVPSTLLFCGPEGVGKTLFAKRFGQALLDTSKDVEAHPDFHHLYPEGKSGVHTIEAIRAWIAGVHLPPYESRAKIFLLHHADRLQTTASYVLLKTLEEPPQDTYFFLVTHHHRNLPRTVLSRCRMIRFYPIPLPTLRAYLQGEGDQACVERAVAFSQGRFSKARAVLASIRDPRRDMLLGLLTDIPRCACGAWHDILERLEKDTREVAGEAGLQRTRDEALLDDMLYWYRDWDLLSQGHKTDLLYHRDRVADLRRIANHFLPPPMLLVYNRIEAAQAALAMPVRLRTVVEGCLVAFQGSIVAKCTD